ncbi:DNA mismatch repair endonuclease MutL [Corallincola spongiicola]|uniref:DNA mismatch repair protein MutL n=1 Tax=Corallincola spongiicola TaxID=2520508 RepID=A0ABY1WQV9_9GAMM|nr:DNA mismatch repair endonuclease MutL [Corallincola spongiicola]TAA47008.1 DNA mismatch repair endonuclease MutL [Corallincola spongiicola]
MPIQILPPRLANQIAAGEVVERPASVVKELLENSLDAGATRIQIDILRGGHQLIRIRDNGCGVEKEQLTLALSRHATSKVSTLDDLEAITSMGFRGEALASISSVSRLIFTSRSAEQSEAWAAKAEGRDMTVELLPASHPQGTTVEVADLFFNTPARRRFLRTEKTEFNHIDEVVKRIGLARQDVSITLTHNGKPVRQFRSGDSDVALGKRLQVVFGQKFLAQAIQVKAQHHDMQIRGWLAHPQACKPSHDYQYCYVNGRVMRDKLINHAVRQAYDELLPADLQPVFLLYFDIDPRQVDVNVHPAKHEVRFHQSRLVHDYIYQVLHQALNEGLNWGEIAAPETLPESVVADSSGSSPSFAAEAKTETSNDAGYQPPALRIAEPQSAGYDGRARHAPSTYRGQGAVEPAAAAAYSQLMTVPADDSAATPVLSGDQSTDLQWLAIHQQHYLLFRDDGQLYLAALIPAYQQRIQCALIADVADGIVAQPLLLPVSFSLSDELVHAAQHHEALLTQLGLQMAQPKRGKLILKTIPARLRQVSWSTIIPPLLEFLSQNAEVTLSQLVKWLAMPLATAQQTQSLAQLQHWLQEVLPSNEIDSLLRNNSIEIGLNSAMAELSNRYPEHHEH